jgi:hypothetical protein
METDVTTSDRRKTFWTACLADSTSTRLTLKPNHDGKGGMSVGTKF